MGKQYPTFPLEVDSQFWDRHGEASMRLLAVDPVTMTGMFEYGEMKYEVAIGIQEFMDAYCEFHIQEVPGVSYAIREVVE